ncbi:MAG: glycosyltransferase [Kiritimatiellia bacterium]|jgi:cellulose synthase/poly-beta-1,6-N-acetylglucosamine synthase-like glycosyltransferase|nr:glycosyltransferase [Kiritimatiellia bacterium]
MSVRNEVPAQDDAGKVDPLALSHARPEWSASQPMTPAQKRWLFAVAAGVAGAALVWPLRTAQGLIAACTALYVVVTLYKFIVIRASLSPSAMLRFTPRDLTACGPREWPVFSVLVPMYKEPETVRQMVSSLEALDYPADRKDVQILLEADDAATCEAARALSLPEGFRLTIVPPSFPRTKPKACNVGLALARGEYLVIYDAEDLPERDQLKKAVLAFESSPDKVVCIQSRLNYYNPRQNTLTRWFTAEYSAWFDLQLPGLAALGAVIPLGGTSNHFRTAVLRELMGWDAYNVTEDCDLGVRLARAGYATRMLETTTWEEACSRPAFWIRQRTRWQKGYIQTWFVHMRRPLALLRELGPVNFLHYQLLIGGVTFSVLVNPVFWMMALVWFVFRPDGVAQLFPGPVFAAGALCLFLGNFVFLYVNLLGCCKRGQDSLMWWALLTPVYWVMMSYSGWRAVVQFFRDPFVWEKTQHGLGSPAGAAAARRG